MPYKYPTRKAYEGELMPLVPRKISKLHRFLHPEPGVTPTEIKCAGKPKKKPKKPLPTLCVYKSQYWELGFKPKKKNYKKKNWFTGKPVRKRIATLRKSITPGTILILLAGRFRGKRCIFLKQLEHTGTLLCCGPKRLNGIGLIRIPQAYVIATRTKVPLEGSYVKTLHNGEVKKITLQKKIEYVKDNWFEAAKKWRENKGWKVFKTEEWIQNKTEKKKYWHAPRKTLLDRASKEINKAVFQQVLRQEKKRGDDCQVRILSQYLGSKFRLKRKDNPHDMKF